MRRAERADSPSPLRLRLAIALAVAVVALHATTAQAQVTTLPITEPGSVGTLVEKVGDTFDITGGTRAGSNLFHSFVDFSVGPLEIADFRNTTGPGIVNILGRVTGGQVSAIEGKIQTTGFPGANLFLANPAGWVFGPGATLNVSGSFHVSTADYFRFEDSAGSTFCVSACPNGQSSTLSVAAPAAFGFLGPSAGSISIHNSTLQVPDRATLSIVGGRVEITESSLVARGGRVQIGSFASEGEATLNGLAGAFTDLAPIQISNSFIRVPGTTGLDELGNLVGIDGGSVHVRGGEVDVSGTSIDASGALAVDDFGNVLGTAGGTVVIRGGQLFLTGSSSISVVNNGSSGPEVAIQLEATGGIVMREAYGLEATSTQSGDAGDVRILADSLQMRESAFIDSITEGGGRGADVFIDVRQLTLEGGARIGSTVRGSAAAAGGDITVTADDGPVTITGEGSGIVSLALSFEPTANGGAVTLSAQSLAVGDLGTIGTTAFDLAPGGAVAVTVGDLSLRGGGTIISSTFSGQGGDLSVTVTGSALISGAGSGIFSGGDVFGFGSRPAGDIVVDAGSLTVTDFGVIQNGTTLDVAGDIGVTAESIFISNGGAILSQAFTDAVGDVTISAWRLLTIDNGLIQTSTIQAGNAGNIFADVGTLTLTRGGQIVASSALSATGAGGSITITANDVTISGRAPSVPVSSFSEDLRSGLFSTTDGFGPAGRIAVAANTISLLDGATISASSTGSASALAGDVNVVFGETLLVQGASITTASDEADGGNIAITSTGSLLQLSSGQITTSVQSGVGGGGNITLGSHSHPLSFVVLSNSAVQANAFGGPGGNIGIFADVYLTSGSLVSASSTLSAPGTINVEARISDLSGSLVQLPDDVLQAAALLRASCAARISEGQASSLVVAGREGVPPQPEGLLWSPLGAAFAEHTLARGGQPESGLFPRFTRVLLGSNCAM